MKGLNGVDKNGRSSDDVALIITAAMMEAGMRDDQEVRELPEAIRKLKDDRPKLKNLKMLDDIHGVVMRHSANRELADKVVNHLRWRYHNLKRTAPNAKQYQSLALVSPTG